MKPVKPLEAVASAKTLQRVPFGTEPAEVGAIVERDGGVILTGALTRGEVDAINHELDEEFGRLTPGNLGDGEDNFIKDFMGWKTKRLMHCVKLSETLRNSFYCKDILPHYIASVMPGNAGTHTMYSSQAIEIYPGEKVQQLHRDGGGLMEIVGEASCESVNLQVNFLIALTEVTEEMGATRVIPGSNHWASYETPGEQEQTIPATMDPGDVLMISGKVLHGGGANRTADRPRRVLSTAFSPGIILGEEAWPHVISVGEAKSYAPRIQRFLGFRSVSFRGETPGFLWRVEAKPLEEFLGL